VIRNRVSQAVLEFSGNPENPTYIDRRNKERSFDMESHPGNVLRQAESIEIVMVIRNTVSKAVLEFSGFPENPTSIDRRNKERSFDMESHPGNVPRHTESQAMLFGSTLQRRMATLRRIVVLQLFQLSTPQKKVLNVRASTAECLNRCRAGLKSLRFWTLAEFEAHYRGSNRECRFVNFYYISIVLCLSWRDVCSAQK
jgi:hypothetical protein